MPELSPWNPSLHAVRRVKDALPAPKSCTFCKGEVAIVHHNDIFGRACGDWPWVYACQSCDARVGMHPQTNIPLGTLADHELREVRKRAKAPFQLLHESGLMSRREAYQALADELSIPVNTCHFGWFNLKQCELAEAAAQEIYHRSFARVSGPTGAPDWFRQGTLIADVAARSKDVATHFEPEDFELEWRECLIPMEALGIQPSLDAYLDGLPGDRAEHEARHTAVGEWMAESGGAETALEASPLLCFLSGGQVLIDDGWHRLGVARFIYHATHVRALCAIGLPGMGLDEEAA